VVSWNAIIFGYVKCGQGYKALQLLQQMQEEVVLLDPTSFVGVLNAFASAAALEEGRCADEQIIQIGCQSNVFVGNSLVVCEMWENGGCMESLQLDILV
jgi:pentatricopeptide repeat protein